MRDSEAKPGAGCLRGRLHALISHTLHLQLVVPTTVVTITHIRMGKLRQGRGLAEHGAERGFGAGKCGPRAHTARAPQMGPICVSSALVHPPLGSRLASSEPSAPMDKPLRNGSRPSHSSRSEPWGQTGDGLALWPPRPRPTASLLAGSPPPRKPPGACHTHGGTATATRELSRNRQGKAWPFWGQTCISIPVTPPVRRPLLPHEQPGRHTPAC